MCVLLWYHQWRSCLSCCYSLLFFFFFLSLAKIRIHIRTGYIDNLIRIHYHFWERCKRDTRDLKSASASESLTESNIALRTPATPQKPIWRSLNIHLGPTHNHLILSSQMTGTGSRLRYSYTYRSFSLPGWYRAALIFLFFLSSFLFFFGFPKSLTFPYFQCSSGKILVRRLDRANLVLEPDEVVKKTKKSEKKRGKEKEPIANLSQSGSCWICKCYQ